MATPAPNRSLYRQRRIDAMLQEGTSTGPTPPESPPAAQQTPRLPQRTTADPPLSGHPSAAQQAPRLPQRPGWKQALSSGLTSLHFIYIGSAAVFLCALAACFVLFRQDHFSAPKVQVPAGSVTASVPVKSSASSVPTRVISPPTETPKRPEPAPEPVQFKIRRSKSFEKIGPVRLRLIKAYPKRNACDLYIAAGGPSYQKQVHLDEPVQIDFPNGSRSAELVVTSIRADQISGSVQ